MIFVHQQQAFLLRPDGIKRVLRHIQKYSFCLMTEFN